MTMDPDRQRELREALAGALEDMGRNVAEPIVDLKKRQRTARIVIWSLVWLKILTTTAIVILVIALGNAKDQQNQIEEIQDRTTNEVLCPLYQLFEQVGKRPAPPGTTPEQKVQRQKDFANIAAQAEALGCDR